MSSDLKLKFNRVGRNKNKASERIQLITSCVDGVGVARRWEGAEVGSGERRRKLAKPAGFRLGGHGSTVRSSG